MLKPILHILRSSDWAYALDFISPAFFDVVPTQSIAKLMLTMSRDYADPRRDKAARLIWEKLLLELPGGLQFGFNKLSSDVSSLSAADKLQRGQALLQLYFACILFPGPNLLDLRANSFTRQANAWLWQPKSLIYTWDPDFQVGLVLIYEGYYNNQPQLFERGLHALNLYHAKDIFYEQFGDGTQDAIKFRLADFQRSFHAVFMSCRKHRTRLHPAFFPLGALLFGLYEHAEILDLALDVRGAYAAVRTAPSLAPLIQQLKI